MPVIKDKNGLPWSYVQSTAGSKFYKITPANAAAKDKYGAKTSLDFRVSDDFVLYASEVDKIATNTVNAWLDTTYKEQSASSALGLLAVIVAGVWALSKLAPRRRR